MAKIVESTEEHGLDRIAELGTKPKTQGGAITLAAADVASFVEAKYVCVFTESGDSARRMSRLRFRIPMKAFTPNPEIHRRMALIWGIESFIVDRVTHTDAMYHQVDEILLGQKLAEIGDKVVVISGSPPGIAGSTNDLRVHVIGDAINAKAPAWESK
jgi:pyruvate kinase